eukprot:g27649.t1
MTGLQQVVRESTREKNILNFILTNLSAADISGHDGIAIVLKTCAPETPRETLQKLATPIAELFRYSYNRTVPTLSSNMDKRTDSQGEVTVPALDIKATLDRVRHQGACVKLESMGIRRQTLCWLELYLEQKKMLIVVGGYEIKQSKIVDKDTTLHDALNAFYARLKQNAIDTVSPVPTAPDAPVPSITAADVSKVNELFKLLVGARSSADTVIDVAEEEVGGHNASVTAEKGLFHESYE